MTRPDDAARRFDGDYRPRRHHLEEDMFRDMNARQMRLDRLRDAWLTIRPAVWLVLIGIGAWLMLHMATVALGAIADPAVGAW